MNKVCFLDMDGVLTDFTGAALAIHGKYVEPLSLTWGFPEQIGFRGINDPDFWAPLGHDFWASLPWCKGGRRLLEGLESMFGVDNIALLSSPCTTKGGVEGKISWIKTYLPEYSRRFFVGPAKSLVAGPGKILVDDYHENCRLFREAGGKAVLVPRAWNDKRDEVNVNGDYNPETVLIEVSKARNA